jgi:carbon dioxide concentrating mechanism protein CcmN
MHLPPLHLNHGFQTYTSGDVRIDPSAAIAPGVILQAEGDYRIEVAAGVCIGVGAILHAIEGNIKIETGAALGAGILLVGAVEVGANACVGSLSTIWNQSINPGQVVPPGSLLSVLGREVPEISESTSDREAKVTKIEKVSVEVSEIQERRTNNSETLNTNNSSDRKPKVYGQDKLNQMLESLFPHRNALKQSLPSQDYQDPNNTQSGLENTLNGDSQGETETKE